MRKLLSELLHSYLVKDNRLWLLTADLGFGVLDNTRQSCPDRAINVGASEQLMLGAAVGLADSGKIPLCYSITPFIIFRPYEWIRLYLNHESVPVKLIGIGRDNDYDQGFSHDASDDEAALAAFPNIVIYKPNTLDELRSIWEEFLYNQKPCYLNIKRTL